MLPLGIFFIACILIGIWLYHYFNRPNLSKKKKYLNENDNLSEIELKSVLILLKEIFIKNLENTHKIIYYMTPSMIDYGEKEFEVQSYESKI